MKRPTYGELTRLILNALDELYERDEAVALLAKKRVEHAMRELVQQTLDLIERKQ